MKYQTDEGVNATEKIEKGETKAFPLEDRQAAETTLDKKGRIFMNCTQFLKKEKHTCGVMAYLINLNTFEKIQAFDIWMRKIRNIYYGDNDKMVKAYESISNENTKGND